MRRKLVVSISNHVRASDQHITSFQVNPEDSESTDTSIEEDDFQPLPTKPKRVPKRPTKRIGLIPKAVKKQMIKEDVPLPDRILYITEKAHRKAMDFLEGPRPNNENKHEECCIDHTFTKFMGTGSSLSKAPMSETHLFQEMLHCLEQQDLDGFLGCAIGAFPTLKRSDKVRQEMLLAACYALFYHPAAKDEEVFQRSLEGLFQAKPMSTRSIDQILRMIMSAFEFENKSKALSS